jgi:tetratricopeptide (TPR) repeat protein
MIKKVRTILLTSILLLCTMVIPAKQRAFSNVDIGTEVKNEVLPTLDGGKQGFLGDKEKVNVFFFFKPNQESSVTFLRELQALHLEMEERPVYWSAIVSDRHATDTIRTVVTENKLTVPVLLDHEDKLFGTLGVALHPVVGMTDGDHVLRVYLHFRKVNFIQLVRAHVQHLLGDINDEELARILKPEAVVQGGDSVAAQRLLKMAKMLFKAGKIEKALSRTSKSLEKDPSFVPAYLLLGKIQMAKNDKVAAAQAFRKALELEPGNAEAQQGLQLCQENG